MLAKAAEAVQSINRFFSALHASDLYLEPGRAIEIAEDGLRFMRRLAWLAKQATKDERALWLLTPKVHIMHHLLLKDMLLPAQQGISPMNVLAWSVQMDEDFVGVSSRLARACGRAYMCETLHREISLGCLCTVCQSEVPPRALMMAQSGMIIHYIAQMCVYTAVTLRLEAAPAEFAAFLKSDGQDGEQKGHSGDFDLM